MALYAVTVFALSLGTSVAARRDTSPRHTESDPPACRIVSYLPRATLSHPHSCATSSSNRIFLSSLFDRSLTYRVSPSLPRREKVLTGGPEKQNINDLKLPYAAPIIETVSTQYSRDVADWLAESGAKMYGAFWCSHCEDQKETFGKGAAIPYVECFPNGWEKGTPIADACKAAKVDGFPTWVLGDGTVISGEKSVDELAKASGYEGPRGAPPAGLDADAMLADFLN